MFVEEKELREQGKTLMGEIRLVAKELGGEITYLNTRIDTLEEQLNVYYTELRRLNQENKDLKEKLNENSGNI